LSFFGLIAVATLGIMNVGYRADRITQWLNVEEEGYQILQGLYAVCSGGWFGKGLGNSVQKLGYIPEVHTDMIFAVICEELGIIGVVILLLVYGVLLWRIYKISINAPDLFGSLLCTGVFSHIALQILLNIAVVTNTVPSTGVTLPFISYGGTSIMAMFIEMGLVLSVAGRIEHEI
jgi:cell division protein FtsW